MKKISLFFVSVIIFTGLVILQTTANATEDTINKDSGVKTAYNDSKSFLFISSKVKIELTKTDNIEVGSIFYKINNGSEQEYSEPFSIEEEGLHTITYYSVDKMENKEAAKTLTVIVDNTPAEVALNVTAPFVKKEEVIYASEFFNYQYTIDAKDSSSGVESVLYSVGEGDSAVQKDYFKPFSINSPAYPKVNVAVEDKVGNAASQYTTNIYNEEGTLLLSSAEEVTITIDNTPPEITIAPDKEFFMKDELQVASKEYKFTITATDEESGLKAIYYKIAEDADFILYTGQEITFSTNGYNKIEAIAVDKVGNTSATKTLEFYTDTIPSGTQLKLISAE
jgi:hypothetical protein